MRRQNRKGTMTDIDFEELDRAVQSAIDDFSEESSLDNELAVASSKTQAEFVSPVPTIEPEPTTKSTPAPSPEPKQFFSNPRPVSSRPVAKQPSRSLDSFSSAKSSVELTPTVKREKATPEIKKGPVIDVINPIKRSPVKELRNHTEPKITPESEQPKEPILDDSSTDIFDLEENTKDSPFIENLKVDKRPLGAFSSTIVEKPVATTTAEEPVEKSLSSLLDEAPAETSAEEPTKSPVIETPTYIGGVDEAQELPAELQDDVLAVESTGMIHEQEPLSDENVGLKEATENSSSAALSSSVSGEKTEKTNTEETVYTSEAYTKPLAHPQKKKTGWFSVVLIILLLLVGAGAGFAIYYFKLF